jgi:hypothetical protein
MNPTSMTQFAAERLRVLRGELSQLEAIFDELAVQLELAEPTARPTHGKRPHPKRPHPAPDPPPMLAGLRT